MADERGRPEYTDEQYEEWLNDLKPFLKLGQTLNSAIDDAGWQKHKATIYEKYRLKDWFSEKVDTYRAYPGKLSHDILVRVLMDVAENQKQGKPITEDQMKNVRFYAEKSRSAQPYFVNRQEVVPTKPIEDVLNDLEKEVENKDDVAEQIAKQMVAANAPVQNQDQTGGAATIQPEPNATTA